MAVAPMDYTIREIPNHLLSQLFHFSKWILIGTDPIIHFSSILIALEIAFSAHTPQGQFRTHSILAGRFAFLRTICWPG